MNKFGFIRVACAIPNVKVGDVESNTASIIDMARKGAEKGVDIILFPELSLTGYTCGDLFFQSALLDKAEESLGVIADKTKNLGIGIIVGIPVRGDNSLFNAAIMIKDGELRGGVPKTYIPNYNEFYEKRWFKSGRQAPDCIDLSGRKIPFGTDILFQYGNTLIGIEICEDLWVVNPPSSQQALAGATIILNPSATDEISGKHAYLCNLISSQSARCRCGYVYCSAGFGESSTDLVFAGNGIIAEDGQIIARNHRFELDPSMTIADIDIEKLMADRRKFTSFSDADCRDNYRIIEIGDSNNIGENSWNREIDPLPFVPNNPTELDERCNEIINIQSEGLMRRLNFTKIQNVVIGISGGLDSTLALLVTVRAFDRLGLSRKGIHAITMPGFGTTDRTLTNARLLMETLGVSIKEIPIRDAVKLHFNDIGHNIENHDITYENSQARERTQILMDYANMTNGLVIGTGDLSELALGWATYNGDHMSMYGVNAGVPKTLVRHLVAWFADKNKNLFNILSDIIDTPVSPELLPADDNDSITQRTEDLVGPYELHDFFLYWLLRYGFSPAKIFSLALKAFEGKYDRTTILKWMKTFYRRFFAQQFKRSCMPDGPKVGSVCLSPRGDWRMPSDASVELWLNEIEKL